MNLKEARRLGKLKEFAKEHEVKDPHPLGKERFDGLMDAMARGKPGTTASAGTSKPVRGVGSSGTRTRRGT